MKSKVVVLIIVLVAVSGLAILFTSNNSDNSSNFENANSGNSPVSMNTELDTSSEDEQTSIETTGSESGLGYIEYSEQSLADSSNSKRVLFFHAPWCSVCNFYEGQIEEQGVPSDVTILKIDYDSEDELKDKYNITTQSTFVLLDADGNIENTWPFAQGLNGIQDLYNQI